MGQKQYIWGIARCYSVENLKLLNERRLKTVLDQELDRRLKTPSLSMETKENLLKEYKASTRAIEKRTVKSNFIFFVLILIYVCSIRISGISLKRIPIGEQKRLSIL